MRYQRFESAFLQRRVRCETASTGARSASARWNADGLEKLTRWRAHCSAPKAEAAEAPRIRTARPQRTREITVTTRLPPSTSAKPSCGGPGPARSQQRQRAIKLAAQQSHPSLPAPPPSAVGLFPCVGSLGRHAPVALCHRPLLRPLDVCCGAQTEEIRQSLPLGPRHHPFVTPFGVTAQQGRPALAPERCLFDGTPNLGGPIITAGGLVFVASAMDNYLHAFDIESGVELWKGVCRPKGRRCL